MHSLTPDSPLFDDGPLLDSLARLRDTGVAVGFTTSGQGQAETILRAMELTKAGAALFSAVQATWNLSETSAGPALAAASRRELTVIVKEALANGRLVTDPPAALLDVADRHGAARDAVALAAAAAQPWADRVLLGAAGVWQLEANLLAGELDLDAAELELLAGSPEDPAEYWRRRSELPWR